MSGSARCFSRARRAAGSSWNPRRHRALVVGIAAMVGIVAGCGAAATPSPSPTPTAVPSTAASAAGSASTAATNKLAVGAKEYAFDLPTTAPAGPTTITLTNQGKEEHQAQVARLNSGVTPDQLQAAMKNPDPSAALKLVTLVGGPNAVAPGASISATSNLTAGQYVFLCFLPAPDGLPHVAKGMVAPLQVTGSASAGAMPAGEATLNAKEFSFDVPSAPLNAGKHTLTFTNSGQQPHEAGLVKLNAGVTVDQIKQLVSGGAAPSGSPAAAGASAGASAAASFIASAGASFGAPAGASPAGSAGTQPALPWTEIGGVAGISPGETATFDVDVAAGGSYAFVCFIPDPATGKPHFQLGMIAPLTVK